MYLKERKMFPQLNYAVPLIVKIPQVGRCENVKEKKKVVLELVKLVHTRSESKTGQKEQDPESVLFSWASGVLLSALFLPLG